MEGEGAEGGIKIDKNCYQGSAGQQQQQPRHLVEGKALHFGEREKKHQNIFLLATL